MYEDKHTPLLSANFLRPTNNGGFTVNKQQRRGSNLRPSGREPNSLSLRHGSTNFELNKRNTCIDLIFSKPNKPNN